MENLPISNILTSVTNKTNLDKFIKKLKSSIDNLNVIASSSTAKFLNDYNIKTTSVTDYTGFKECFSGRVKTLHPKIAGGILLDKKKDLSEAKQLGIKPIDMVVCNLYDFKSALNNDFPIEELIEYIDIGGPTLIRAAAKNFKNVAVVTSPDDYAFIVNEVIKTNGCLSLKTRLYLAAKAFQLSAEYETMISSKLSECSNISPVLYTALHNKKELRYGENPDQKGWVFQLKSEEGLASSTVLTGKQLSYNNYEDATIALNASTDLKQLLNKVAVSVVKHGSLCGLASAENLDDAFLLAWNADSKSAFGSVIAINENITEDFFNKIKDKFIEVIIAKSFSDSFVELVKRMKPSLRLIPSNFVKEDFLYKKINGGMLVQTPPRTLNLKEINQLLTKSKTFKKGVVTTLTPPQKMNELIAFSIIATKYVKSNAIVIAREVASKCYQTIGIGSGQPNRIDSMELLAIPKALKMSKDISSCVLTSDGFFPFPDSIDSAKKANVKWIVQPGGSKKDIDVIKSADQCEIGMIFTGQRYFSH